MLVNSLSPLVFAVGLSATTGKVNTGCTLMRVLASTSCFLKSFPSSSIETWTSLTCPIPETPTPANEQVRHRMGAKDRECTAVVYNARDKLYCTCVNCRYLYVL